MTETVATPTTETSAPASPPPSIEVTSEEMTPAEREYFKSGGTKTDGLFKAPDPTPVGKEQNGSPAPAAAGNDVAAEGSDEEPGEITIDAHGNAKDTKTGRFVPKSAYLRVKEEAKATGSELQKAREQLIAIKERAAILEEVIKPVDPQKPAEPAKPVDPKEDIFGAFEAAMSKIAELEKTIQTTTTQTQAQLTAQRMQEAFKVDAATFARSQPAFVDAYNFLTGQRHAELEALGIDDKAARDQQIAKEANHLVTEALKGGKSGAERLYKLAVARGFQPKAPNAEDPTKKALEEIARIQKGQEASQTLRGSGSGGAPEALTQARLASMSDSEYATTRSDYIAKNGKAAWDRLAFGR